MVNGGPRPTPSQWGGRLPSRPRSCHAWTSWPCPGSGPAPSRGPATPRRPPPGLASLAAAPSCTAPAASPAWPRLGPLPRRPPTPLQPPASPSAGPAQAAPDTPHPVSAGSGRVALGPVGPGRVSATSCAVASRWAVGPPVPGLEEPLLPSGVCLHTHECPQAILLRGQQSPTVSRMGVLLPDLRWAWGPETMAWVCPLFPEVQGGDPGGL